MFKELKKIVWVDKEMEESADKYLHDYYNYWHDFNGRELPFYALIGNQQRKAFLHYASATIACATLGIIAIFTGWPRLVFLVLFALCCVSAIIMSYPSSYWQYRKDFRNVRTIRLLTDEVVGQFNRDYETLEAIMEPYKAKLAEEEAKAKAKAAEQQRIKEEEDARNLAEAKKKFYPQFMALLKYVEENFGVTTPNPECREGKFTINLPNDNIHAAHDEWIFDYGEGGIGGLIATIASMDYVMRKRCELRRLANSATIPAMSHGSAQKQISPTAVTTESE